MNYLLDTDMCSYLMRGDNPVLWQRLHQVPEDAAAMSVITQGELQAGMARVPRATRLKVRLAQLGAGIPTLPMPPEAAWHYAAVRSHLERKGKPIGGNDLWIAAHALAENRVLVTNNTREFSRVPGLTLDNWLA